MIVTVSELRELMRTTDDPRQVRDLLREVRQAAIQMRAAASGPLRRRDRTTCGALLLRAERLEALLKGFEV